MMSRINILNPLWYIKLEPFVRREALKSLGAFMGAGLTTLGLAKAAGAEVGVNPFSADFGKIKIGDTRIDPWGGFSQYIRTLFQVVAGKTTSSTTGKTLTAGKQFNAPSRLEILGRSLEYKEAPLFSLASTLLRGKTLFGDKLNIPQEVAQRFIPMVMQDAWDLYKINPDWLPVAGLGIFGVGLQTYTPTRKTKTY